MEDSTEERTGEPLSDTQSEPQTEPQSDAQSDHPTDQLAEDSTEQVTTEQPASEQSQTDDVSQDQEHFCCSFCKEKFTAIEELLSHIRIHTGGVDSEEDQDEAAQAPQKLKRLSVRLPLLKTGNLSSLDSNEGDGACVDEFERTDATPGYQCPTCKRRFSRIIHQLNHKCEPTQVETRLDAINSSLKLFKCVICKEEFGTRQEKLDHKCLPQESQEEAEVPSSTVDDAAIASDNQGNDYESDEDDTGTLDDTAQPHVGLKLTIKAPSKKGFGRSRRRKAKANHRCNVCHRSFTRSWNLKVHMQKAHAPGSPVPKVSPVKTSPRVSSSPARKTPESKKPATADIGGFDFDFIPSYSEKNMVLRRVPSTNAYECPLCGRTMERREAMLSHIRDHRGETPYNCSHCDYKCTHSAKILKHLNHTHRIAQTNNPPLFEAMKAQTQDSDWQPRKEPYRNFYKIVRSENERMYKPKKQPDTGAFACPICHKIFARFGVAQVHIRVHTGDAPFRCLLCDYQGKQQSLILAHLEHNHKEVITNSNSHRDEEVDAELAMEDGDEDVDEEEWEKRIDYEEGLVRDKTVESENDSEIAQLSENQDIPAKSFAEADGYDFRFRPTENERDRVLFRSSLTKMFLCYLCPKEVKEKEIMLAHIRTHTGDKAYYCNYCEFGSAHDAAMRKHLVNVHGIKHARRPENTVEAHIRFTTKRPPSKPVMVTSPKEFESPPKKSSKEKRTTPQKSQSHKASTPNKEQPKKKKAIKKEPAQKQPKAGPSYSDFYIVEKSEKEQECKPQKNEETGLYKCHFCKLESYSYKTVVIHTRSHTGEKPYKCRLCTFSGGQSSHVIRHLKNTHRVSLDDDGQSDDADDEPPELKREDEQESKEEEAEGKPHEDQVQEDQMDEENDANINYSSDVGGDDVDADVDLAPVDYFAPSVPDDPVDIPPPPLDIPLPPKLVYKDDSSQDETVEEGSQEGGDNDPDWETWMDRKTLNTEVRSAYKGKGKGKLTSPKSAKINYIFAPSESEKQLDLKKGADKQFDCPTCGKKMREMEIILAHIRTHTGEKPYCCCHCDFTSAHIASIRKHVVRVHHVKRPISGSDQKTPLAATPVKQLALAEPKKSPRVSSSDGLESPAMGQEFEEMSGDTEDKTYSEGGSSDGYINKFFKVTKRDKPREKKYLPTRDSDTGRAQCRICKGTFSSYGKAVVHIRSHTGEKPYVCLLCDYTSSQNPNMKRHIRNQHKDALYGNIDPTQIKPKEVSTGNIEDNDGAVDSFTEAPGYDDYNDDHDLSGPSMVQRTDFLSQAALSEQHADRKGRPDYLFEPTERMKNFEPKRCPSTGMFECSYCSSQFYGLKKIETHVLKHTGEKPYLCMHCDFKSAYSFVMYRHLLNRHQIEKPNHPGSANDNPDEGTLSGHQDMESSAISDEHDSAYTTIKPITSETLPNSGANITNTPDITYPEGDFDFIFRPTKLELAQVVETIGEGRYRCPHCKKQMSNRKKMVTHIRTHTGEKPFFCSHCDFKTAYKFVIQTHIKGIHKIQEPKGDDELIEAQRARATTVTIANEAEFDPQKVVIKQEPLDESDGFNEMVASMSGGGIPDGTNDDTSSMEDDALSDYSVQKEGQLADCVFRPTDTETNRKLYRPSPGGPCQCPFCSRWLQGVENMRAHIRGHTGDKPYYCSHCDHQSAHFAAIKRHLIKVHKLSRPVMPGDVATLIKPKKVKQKDDMQKRPGLVVKFKNVSYPSSPLKPTQTKFKTPTKTKSAASRAKALAPFTGRDRTLTHFYRNFYNVTKSDEMKKFTPKKDPVTKMFHCNFCEKRFNYHTEAQVHTRTHTGEKPYACLVCDYKGSQWTNIIRHITCVHKKVLEARQREEGIGNLPPEENEVDQSLDMSRFSQESTSQVGPIHQHEMQKADTFESSNTFEPNRSVLKEQRRGPLPTSQVEADYLFQPSKEEKKRTILPSMKTGLYSCIYCKKKVPNLGKIVTHIRTHTGEKPFICSHCNFKSAYKFVMTQHLSGRHGIKKPKTLPDENEATGMEAFLQDGQSQSMDMASTPGVKPQIASSDFRFEPSERERTMKLSRKSGTGCFECMYCGRQFSSSETMKAHIRGHTGDKAYFCNHCTFASAHVKSIRNHIQKVHSIVYPKRSGSESAHSTPSLPIAQAVPRPVTSKVFPASQIPKEIYLKYVVVNKTAPKKFPPKRNPRTGRYKCHFCTMESKQLYTVEIHTMRHTGERPYHCKLCEYKATRQWLVTQHLQTNHKHILAANEGLTLIPKETMNPPAPTAVKLPQSGAEGITVCRSAKSGMYFCSACRKEFMSASQCRDHITTHSGELYKCPFCEHRSAHGGAMRNHMKIQHGNDSDELKKWYTYTMGKIAMQHVFQRDHEGMYMCTYCNKKSNSLNSARRHLCVHTGEKPYSCKLCSFKAIHNISIRLHVTGHHKQVTSQGTPDSTSGQRSGLKDLAEETSQDFGQDDDWEDVDDGMEEDSLVIDEQIASNEDKQRVGQDYRRQYRLPEDTPISSVPPAGQVPIKDADFLYVPSDVDKTVMLHRTNDSQMYECPYCSKQMTNTRTMRAHIRLHKGEKAYHCRHCDYKSAHYSVLRKHVVTVHKIQRPRMATENEEQDAAPSLPPQHDAPMRDVVREQRRVVEDQEPPSLDDLNLENPSNIPTNMNPDSDRGFIFDANEEEKKSWQELQTTGTCQCPQCGKHCSSPIRTLQHMRTHSGAKPYYCRYCTFRSAYDTSMRSHVRTMHEAAGVLTDLHRFQDGDSEMENMNDLAEMEALEKRSSTRSEVNIKKEPVDNGYEKKPSENDAPPEMAWTFNEEDQSATLVPQYMAPPIIEEEPPSLHRESSPSSEDQGSMNMPQPHRESMSPGYKMSSHPLRPQFPVGDFTFTPSQEEKDRPVVRSPTTGQCKCPYCPQELTSADKIKAHIRKHTGDRPYQCLHCKFSSAYRFVIRTHIKNLHKIPVPKQQKIGVGPSTPQLISHAEKPTHNLAAIFNKPSLTSKKIASPKRYLASGKVCWDEHYKYSPSDEEKKIVLERSPSTGKFHCPYCIKQLTSLDVMRSHIRTHTGEKPYYCSHCYFRSAHYDSIRKHLIIIHKLKHESTGQVADQGEQNTSLVTEQEPQQSDSTSKFHQTPIIPTTSSGSVDFVFKPSDYEKRVRIKKDPTSGLLQCPQCSKLHKTPEGVLAHLRSHTGDKPYYCKHCEYSCPNLSAINLHLYIVHNVTQPDKPGTAMTKSPSKPSTDNEDKYEVDKYRHLFIVTKDNKKDRKGQTFKRNPVTRAYQCNYCPKESKHHYVIQIHMRTHTGVKPYQCRLCDYQGAQQSRILFHLKSKHGDYLKDHGMDEPSLDGDERENASSQGDASTGDASTGDPSIGDASIGDPSIGDGSIGDISAGDVSTGDEEMVTPQFKVNNSSGADHYVPKLGVDFTLERIEAEEVILEKLQQSRDYRCPTCGKRCANAVRTIEHMRQHSGAKPYACMRCSTRSAYDRAMRNHVLLQHGRNAKEKEKLYTFHVGKIERSLQLQRHPRTDRFICPFCEKTFRDVNLARSHVRMHTGELPYKCVICKYRGANTRAIQVHIERFHGNRNTASRPVPTIEPQQGDILRSRLAITDGDPPSTDGSAGDDFKSKTDQDTYTGPKLGIDFTCDKLETDNMYCIDPETGGYKCLYCDKVLKTRLVSKIQTHLLCHTGAKPFKCVQCGFRSAHDGSMRSHVLSQHRNIGRDYEKLYKFKVGKIERNLQLQQEPGGAYVCPYCPKRWKDLYQVKKHIRTHTGEKPYRCRKCSYMASVKWSVILHAQRQHRRKKDKKSKRDGTKSNASNELPTIDEVCEDKVVLADGQNTESLYIVEQSLGMEDVKSKLENKDDAQETEKVVDSNRVSVIKRINESAVLESDNNNKMDSNENLDELGSKTNVAEIQNDKIESKSDLDIEMENEEEQSVGRLEVDSAGDELGKLQRDLGPSEMKESEDFGPSETKESEDLGPSEMKESEDFGPSEIKESEDLGPSEIKESEDVGPSEMKESEDLGPSEMKESENVSVEQDVTSDENMEVTTEQGKDVSKMDDIELEQKKMIGDKMKVTTEQGKDVSKMDDTELEQKEEKKMFGDKIEVTTEQDKDVSKMDDTEVEQKEEKKMIGDDVEKASESDSKDGEQVHDKDQSSEPEEKVTKILDEAKHEMRLHKENSPDYLFLPSKEEKTLFKSNATGSFECPHCSKHFSDIVVMQTHVRNHTGDTPYHCTHCSFKSLRFPEMRQHLLFDHKIHRPKTLQPVRPVLQKKIVVTSKTALDMYRSFFTFAPSESSYKPKRNSSTGAYECPECGNTSKRSNGARVHYRTHSGEKPYHCLLCSYKGAQQSRVVTHIKYNHQDILKNQIEMEPLSQDNQMVDDKVDSASVSATSAEDFDMENESNLTINEVKVKGVKRKKVKESDVPWKHEPMWKKGYDYRPSEAENQMVFEQDQDEAFMCPICPHKHKLKNVVRNHVRKHTGEKPYYCCHCDFTTANFSSMRTHLIQTHKSMPYNRSDTDTPPTLEQEISAKKARLETKLEEEKHVREEETPTEGYTFTRSMLEKSLRLQRSVAGKYQCPYCSYEYGALAIVMAHVRTHTGDKPFQCNYCPYNAADYSAMRKHLIKKHDKWHKANSVSSSPANFQPIERPPVLHHPLEGQSEGLHYIFRWGDAEKGLSFHKSEAGVYECPYCPHQHKKKSVVRAHVRKHTGEKPYLCKHCTFKCANFSWMREHLIKRHELKPEQLSKKFKEPKKSKKNKHSKHLRSVPSEKMTVSVSPPKTAPKYDFLFAPSVTEKHVELSKTKSGSYVCMFCQKELRIMNNMRAHIRGHIGDKPYFCTRCPFRSAHISALRRHLFSQHRITNAKGQKSTHKAAMSLMNAPRSPPTSPRIQQDHIPVIQPLKSSVESTRSPIMHNILTTPRLDEARHLITSPKQNVSRSNQYTGKIKGPKYVYDETPVEIALLKSLQATNTLQCPHCGHKFSSISRTMEHVRKHTGAKPYRCLICNFKSAYEGCMSRHVSLKHELSAQQLAQFFTFKIGDIEKNTEMQKNPETGHYHCPFCEKSWPESAKVKRHMCIHTGEKPYRCNLCGFGAVDKSSMVHHLEMSHKKQITQLKLNVQEEEDLGPPTMIPIYQNSSPNVHHEESAFTVEAKESTKLVLRRVPENRQHELHSPSYHQEPSPTLLNVPSPATSDTSEASGYEYLPSQAEKVLLSKLNIEGKIRCNFCGKTCHSAARTLEHIRMHSGDKPYCCKNCNFASAYEGVMKKHVMVRHGKGTGLSVLYSFVEGKILKSIEFEREASSGRYKCPFCKKTTTSLTGAKRHACIHTGEKPYKCKLCSYAANERSTILWHIDRQHQNADEHLPERLSQEDHRVEQHQNLQRLKQGQRKSQSGRLDQQSHHGKVDHRKAAVTQALGLAPTYGRKSVVSFNRTGFDQNHASTSTTQLKKVHVKHGDSEAITKLFHFEPGKIERSLNLQRDPNNGRYLCPFCDQTSRDLTNAKNHVRVHIGEKPFKCKLCEYASVQRSLVIAHIEKHHAIYPDMEHQMQDTTLGRHRSPHGRSFQSRGYSSHRPLATAVPYTVSAPPMQGNEMPLDLSKPLDLSGPSKKHTGPEFTPVAERHRYNEDIGMDFSGGVLESQESSLEEDEEAALMEAEMEDEMMTDPQEDDFIGGGDDDERFLEEEMLAAEQGADVVIKQGLPSDTRHAPQRPVSLVKPLNPNEVIDDDDEDSTSGGQGKMRQNVTVGAVVSHGTDPGVSHATKDERNIWDMAFNWSSGEKSGRNEDLDKPSAARRSLEYSEELYEGDMLEEDDIDVDGVESEEPGILGSLLRKDRGPKEDGVMSEHLQSDSPDSASSDPNVAMEMDTGIPQAVTDCDEPNASIPSPVHDEATSASPSTGTWQNIQTTTPIKSPSTATSSALTPERESRDGLMPQDEMSSPLPVITNVMSLNPSLWKSP